jgi:hypothetical protein
MWPLVAGLLALGATLLMRAKDSSSLGRLCVFALGAVPGLLLLAPTIYFLYTALALSMPALLAVLVMLLLGLLTPCIALLTTSKRWLLPGALTLAGLALIMFAAFNTGFDAERPQRSDLFYALNADTGKAIWASTDAKLNGWTAQFLARPERGSVDEFFPSRNRAFLRSEAPHAPLDAPAVAVLNDETINEVRRVRLKISSARQAPNFSVFVEGEVLKAAINGKEFIGTAGTRIPPGSGYNWAIQYAGVPPEGIELMLEVKASPQLKINVVDRTDGLPESLAASFKPRPDNLIPSPAQYSNATVVSRRFAL